MGIIGTIVAYGFVVIYSVGILTVAVKMFIDTIKEED